MGLEPTACTTSRSSSRRPSPFSPPRGPRTSRIEIGTGVVDMRYENPFYMVEDAGAADLISNGRLQMGISRGSPEQVIEGWRHFGYAPAEGETDADMGRRHAEVFLELLKGEGFARPNPRPMSPPPACSGSSRMHRGSASASGGGRPPTRPRSGRRSTG